MKEEDTKKGIKFEDLNCEVTDSTVINECLSSHQWQIIRISIKGKSFLYSILHRENRTKFMWRWGNHQM